MDDSEFEDLYFAQESDAEFGSLAYLAEEEAIALFAERGGDPDRLGKKAPLDCLVWRHAGRESRAGSPYSAPDGLDGTSSALPLHWIGSAQASMCKLVAAI